ncbi:hypothetical protein TrRE_jg9480, partial [Triparma retinervis]
LYISPKFRNRGIGANLLSHLESLAVGSYGALSIRASLSLSQSACASLLDGKGYEAVGPFGDAEGAEVWLEKGLEVVGGKGEGGGKGKAEKRKAAKKPDEARPDKWTKPNPMFDNAQSVAELRRECVKRGLDAEGGKKILIQRLKDDDAEGLF